MKILIEKKYPWSNIMDSSPMEDIAKITYNFFNKRYLFLTEKTIRNLFCHPELSKVQSHVWKYILRVDDIDITDELYDFLIVDEVEKSEWK